jgi:hypothetical protein
MADIYVESTGDDTTGDGSTGNPYKTVQKAINETVADGNIYIKDDLAPADQGVNFDIRLDSNDSYDIVIRSDTTTQREIEFDAASSYCIYCNGRTAGTLTLDNIKIVIAKSSQTLGGVYLTDSHNVTLRNGAEITQGAGVTGSHGIRLNGSSTTSCLTVINSTIDVDTTNAIGVLLSGDGNTIDINNSTITGGTNAIQVNATGTLTGLYVSKNTLASSAGYGLRIGGGAGTSIITGVVTENTITGPGGIAITEGLASLQVDANDVTLSGTATAGIDIGIDGDVDTHSNPISSFSCRSNKVYNISNTTGGHAYIIGANATSGVFANNYSIGDGYGLVLKGNGNTVKNNKCIAAVGLNVKGGDSNEIYNNYFTNSYLVGDGTYLSALRIEDRSGSSGGVSEDNLIVNNVFESQHEYVLWLVNDISAFTSNIIDQNTYYAIGDASFGIEVTASIADLDALVALWVAESNTRNDIRSIETDPGGRRYTVLFDETTIDSYGQVRVTNSTPHTILGSV